MKYLVVGAAVEVRFLWLAVIGILNAVLALGVYLRIIVLMYQPALNVDQSVEKSLYPALVVVIGVAAIVTLGMRLLVGFLPS